MRATTVDEWADGGWRGRKARWVDAGPCLAAVASGTGRTSRHARTLAIASPEGALYVKHWEAPGAWRAWRAFRMGEALVAAGFHAPETVLIAARGNAGLLVTRDAGGEELLAAAARLGTERAAKRRLLRRLGAEVARLHDAGFVHGDLVPTNVRVRDEGFVFLDNDRTRRSRLLVALTARRNLVQLGRFVVPGLTATDRARVLAAYAAGRGLGRGRRRRLAAWRVARIVARRCAIDRIPPGEAARAGFRQLMRSGGPFDPAFAAGGRA
jgi:hypothetical protein